MKDLQPSQRRELLLVDAAGSMRNMNLVLGTNVTDQFVAELGGPGAMLLPHLGWQETGYWNPAVVTNEQGQATVTFTVPQRSTAWKFLAKGITVDTQAGEGTGELLVKKDLFGQLKLPSAFTDGDEVTVPVSVHNQLLTEGKIDVSLKAAMGDWRVEELRTVDVTGKGIQDLVFHVELQRPQATDANPTTVAPLVEFELTVASGELRDVVRQAVPLQPFGMPVHAIAAGQADGDITAWVEPPAGMAFAAPTLQILVGPTVEQSLLDTVLGPASTCEFASRRIASGMESATSDLLAALALQKLMQGTQESGGPQVQSLDGRVRSAVGLLVSSQNDDGGWSWTGRAGTSHRFSTARAVWGLSLARKAGYGVPDETYNKAIDFLRDQATSIASDDYESSAVLLHAMATAGQGDFALANRLYRSRPALSAATLAHLTLAFAEMDRGATAGELLALLGQQNLDTQETRRKAGGGCLPWNHSPTELRALHALALQKVSPHDPAAKSAIDWLLANRIGHRWAPDKATGPATMALCAWFAQNRFDGEHYQLTVSVNDQPAASLDVDPTAGTQTIDVPAALLKDGKQRIHFQITGRGRYTYQCILGGFVPADKLVSTTKEWAIQRTYEPAPREFDGLEIPRGFDVLAGNYSTFRNPLAELPVGRRGLVELRIQRHDLPSNTPEEQLEYLVVTDPIPCGATVIDNSVTGSFERYEIAPGSITFYVGSRQHVGTIQYRLYGYVPGAFQAAPAVLVNAHRPDQFAVSERKQLTILPPGQETRDEYRLTPQELYELGRRNFEKGQLEPARQHLTDLVQNWNLKPDIYRHAVQMLLDAHLELGPASQIVHYFEIVKEKWPAEEIPFAKIVKVGAAYGEIGEFERSYLVFRATVASSFRRESGVAGFLEGQGEFARSVDVMLRLTRDYPPEPYIASAYYALAQRVYAKAPEAAADAKLREQKINRVDLVRRAAQMLETFLTDYPDDPAADQAAFSKANALLELKMYPETVAACNRFTQRYPDSNLLDSSWYMIGYCHFATGKHQEALEMCTKVAEAKRVDKNTGRETESPNKWQAIYILGQVHHSLGQAADAIREYERVQDRFADAKEAIDYFRHVTIHAPEVTTFKPGEPVEIELAFRNIPSCDVKVYRIDLMKLSLLKRDLAGITKVNLAGIRPHFETVVTLGDGKDYRDRSHRLAMPLAEEGAYLVVCRGADLHTSGLVLVTPLAVDVQEDGPSGRVRTTVKDVVADSYVNAVHVKVIGSRNTDFVSGDTDLRGVFVADGILGTSTVIAQVKPSRYAFYRGSTELGPPPTDAQSPMADAAPAEVPAAKGQLLEELQRSNSILQNQQMDLLKQTYESQEKGVQPSEAF
ncbi:MAG: tetratricopeptide repeat protein, partial [Planctomycetes bacterium]|nr:tetratricopeptide repeat protein [Planctomycetota bacterium]